MGGGRYTRSAVGYSRRRDGARLGRNTWILLGCAIVLGALVSLFTIRGVRILDLRHHLQASLRDRDEALAERLDLEKRLARKDDLAAIEDAARELLGWVMPGEERVIFVDRTEASAGGGE